MSDAEAKNDKQPDKNEPIPTASYGDSILGPGGRVGPYKLLSVLGEGGFAVVYLAEQQGAVKRRVALKVIKPGMDTKQVIARFEAERQALALLDHHNIAQVYDAGMTQAGRPYFVMGYVKGLSLTKHCDQEKLGVEERLKLFLQVCEAVQHAHQKAIIHRDIKPSNILVAIEGNNAVPKIIDFGVAKAISQPLTERTLYTEQGQFVGTPEYISPEQALATLTGIEKLHHVVGSEAHASEIAFLAMTLHRLGRDREAQATFDRSLRLLAGRGGAVSDFIFAMPTNLGSTVNSSANDSFQSISADGLSLYFASNRLGGSGRLDLYVTTRETKTDLWGPPVNLGPTINSWAEELLPDISSDGSTLYFCSSRPGGFGNADLWQVSLVPVVDTTGDGEINIEDLCELAEQ